ncbi:MAG: hypothetical protein FJZ96_06975 [Chloroflexi bacterium]|nr:hypothetical protein [Chloroflexota bacterium]
MKRITLNWLSVLLIVSLGMAALPVGGSAASQRQEPARGYNPETGRLAYLSVEAGSVPGFNASAAPQSQAGTVLQVFGTEFGLADPGGELESLREYSGENGQSVIRYRQVYQGIPVLAGEIIINISPDGRTLSISGETSPGLALDVQPVIAAEIASQVALELVAKSYQLDLSLLSVTQPELWIFDESLLTASDRLPELTWRMEVSAVEAGFPVREFILVNAIDGKISLHFNQIDTAWITEYTAASSEPDVADHSTEGILGTPIISVYTMNHSTGTLPGTWVCDETNTAACDGAGGDDADAVNAYAYSQDTYEFYATHHARDSIDGAGMDIISSVHYGTGYANAFWNGAQMVYGDGFAVDDVVGHELTHGVTDYESALIYLYQSGAINESFSDIWGEFVDQTNGSGNDTPSVKWLIGEDIGAIRSMSNPPTYSDPDKITSAYFYTGTNDGGGVHTNSGVNNKAAYLMVEGGSFNSRTITAIGMAKTAAVYYEVQTNLLGMGANYTDLYYALQQACWNLIGGAAGITADDCTQVRVAAEAVEMNIKPSQSYTPMPDVCAAGTYPVDLFSDDFESGLVQWSTGAIVGSNRWFWATPGLSSVSHSLWGDNPAIVSDSYAALGANVALPAGSSPFLYFRHFFEFETSYDGGVLEYSSNDGGAWLDAASLFNSGQNYTGTLSTASDNPIEGRQAFTGVSHSMVGSRYNLASLAGQNVRFRWRMGTDTGIEYMGWLVDDVRLYTCQTIPAWYLAEGYTGAGFGTFILIQNPNLDAANVEVTYMLQGGGTVVRNIVVQARSRYTIVTHDPSQVGPDQAFSTKLTSTQPIIVERAMYWPNGTGTSGGHVTTGITSPAATWYLAEGYTGGGFGTFILIQNPNALDANVQLTYMLQGGGTVVKNVTVPGNSRFTVLAHDVSQVGPDQAFSTRLDSDRPIIVERAMYFNNEGHNAVGITQPQTDWYLAEGYTGAGFGTYILVQNPNTADANVVVTYMIQGGGTVVRNLIVPGNSRATIVAQDAGQVGVDQAFSTHLNSDQPIVVERAMYWPNGDPGQYGGHDSPGTVTAGRVWNLAEGYTGSGFATFILVQNPGALGATVEVTYMLQSGGTIVRTVNVPANSRYTILAHDPGQVGPDQAFSTRLLSDQPIIVERAMYFSNGGHSTTGVMEP